MKRTHQCWCQMRCQSLQHLSLSMSLAGCTWGPMLIQNSFAPWSFMYVTFIQKRATSNHKKNAQLSAEKCSWKSFFSEISIWLSEMHCSDRKPWSTHWCHAVCEYWWHDFKWQKFGVHIGQLFLGQLHIWRLHQTTCLSQICVCSQKAFGKYLYAGKHCYCLWSSVCARSK